MTAARRSWTTPLVIGVAVAALAAGGYVLSTRTEAAPQVTFISIDGTKITPDALRGKVVMVNFWATSCASCIKEMPQMVETYTKFKGQGLEFVAVAMQYDPPNYVLNYAQTRRLPFIVALDSGGDIARAYGDVVMTPTTFVIGKDGKILKRYVGEPEFPALHALLKTALAG